MLKHLITAITGALLLLAGNMHASAAQSTGADSLNRAVAVFIASNVTYAVDNAIADLLTTGADIDTATVRQYVAQELFRRHSDADRQQAIATIENAVAAVMTAANDSILAAAKAAPGAVTLPSGVVIETIADGPGDMPAATDQVSMRYVGRLPDGSVFDSIEPDAAPMTLRPADLVPGMAEGITRMRRGGAYRITIPADMAYGHNGVPGAIPPDCTLQFDITLLDQ